MELKRGQVVRSKAGKGRPLERPKRKNIRHISPTLTVLPEEALATNRKLRAALREAGGQRENIPAEV